LNLARRMVSILPPFSPSSSRRVTNEQCIRESQYYLQELDNLSLWALKSEYIINLHKSQWLLYVPHTTHCITRRIYVFRVITIKHRLFRWCLMETHSVYCCVGTNFCIINSSAPPSAFAKSLQVLLLTRRGSYIPTAAGKQSTGTAIIPAIWLQLMREIYCIPILPTCLYIYWVFSAQADWTLTHASHKETEQSATEASVTLDGVRLTDPLIRSSPNI
jgi:hypothetical protein